MTLRNRFAIMLLVALMLALAGTAVHAAPPIKCAECGMMVDPESKFSARMTHSGASLSFCDIGDLLSYLGRKALPASTAEVKDYKTGTWIPADSAFFVRSEKAFRTPMGWGIAAFASKEDASAFGAPMDIAAALKAIK